LTTVAPEYRLIFVMAALTGYRAGELLALSWSNVNEIKGVVQATHRLWNGKRLLGVKTPNSRKPIQMAGELLMMLREHHEMAEFNGPNDFLFCRADARPYDPQWLLENVWYPALKKIGIEPGERTHGFHLLRHTAATILADVTRDRQLVKDFLRHTQMSTTEVTSMKTRPREAKHWRRRFSVEVNRCIDSELNYEAGFKSEFWNPVLEPGLGKWLRGRDLNPRPLGYEPNELPDCSTPRNFLKLNSKRQYRPRLIGPSSLPSAPVVLPLCLSPRQSDLAIP
jgi:hypothetical protein